MDVARMRWLGHSGFEIELMDKIVLVDPWLDGNPLACIRVADLERALNHLLVFSGVLIP